MEDPKVYEVLSLLLEESIASRKEFRDGFQALREDFTVVLERLENAVERQNGIMYHYLQSQAALQNEKIEELERRLEAVERKVT